VKQKDYRAISRPFVEVVNPKISAIAIGDLHVVRRKIKIRQRDKAFLGSAQRIHEPFLTIT
jgi:hypothetical protein